MMKKTLMGILCLAAATMMSTPSVHAGDGDKEADMTKPVQVYILMGQSNMLAMGKVAGRGGGQTQSLYKTAEPTEGEKAQFVNIAVYDGAYSPEADYAKMKPIHSGEIMIGAPKLKRVKRRRHKIPMPPFPEQALQEGKCTVLSGYISVALTGTYEISVGLQDGAFNVTTVDGKEVYRRDVGQKVPKLALIKLEPNKRYAFRTVCFKKPDYGFAVVQTDLPGTLETLVMKNNRYAYLKDEDGSWKMRKDVRNVFIMNNKLHLNDWMGVKGNKIGVEMAIGNFVGDAVDAPVLILKSCIGNRSLGWDLLPPSSKPYEFEGKKLPGYRGTPDDPKGNGEKVEGQWYAGTQWDTDIEGAKKVLSEIGKYYPGATQYEVAGFFFWQGDKDRYNKAHATKYEENLVNFIKDLRKEFNAPKAPFVCATLGQTPKEGAKNPNEALILKGQMAVDGKSGKYPEFKGNVSTFYSHPVSKGSSSNAHYGGNAETYMNVGEGMGKAMAEMIKKK
jgi:hypothetical protein